MILRQLSIVASPCVEGSRSLTNQLVKVLSRSLIVENFVDCDTVQAQQPGLNIMFWDKPCNAILILERQYLLGLQSLVKLTDSLLN